MASKPVSRQAKNKKSRRRSTSKLFCFNKFKFLFMIFFNVRIVLVLLYNIKTGLPFLFLTFTFFDMDSIVFALIVNFFKVWFFDVQTEFYVQCFSLYEKKLFLYMACAHLLQHNVFPLFYHSLIEKIY